jgi:hypothetical protein
MAANVNANPEDLRRFARSLRQFKSDVEGKLGALNSQFRGLTWSDDQQRRFAQEWDRTSKSLRSFLQQVDSHAPYLERKARQLDEFLRR